MVFHFRKTAAFLFISLEFCCNSVFGPDLDISQVGFCYGTLPVILVENPASVVVRNDVLPK